MNTTSPTKLGPIWLLVVAALGIAWNLFGIVQFVGTLRQTQESLMMGGMTPEQARVYFGLPGWVQLAFGIGVVGGLIGSAALLLRRAVAGVILLISLIAYVVLWIADYVYGVFAVMPGQMAVLSIVVAIAAALLVVSRIARSRGVLA